MIFVVRIKTSGGFAKMVRLFLPEKNVRNREDFKEPAIEMMLYYWGEEITSISDKSSLPPPKKISGMQRRIIRVSNNIIWSNISNPLMMAGFYKKHSITGVHFKVRMKQPGAWNFLSGS